MKKILLWLKRNLITKNRGHKWVFSVNPNDKGTNLCCSKCGLWKDYFDIGSRPGTCNQALRNRKFIEESHRKIIKDWEKEKARLIALITNVVAE